MSHKMLPSMTYALSKFEAVKCNDSGGDTFTRNTLFDLDLIVNATRIVTMYPLHRVTYSGTKFEGATSNSL